MMTAIEDNQNELIDLRQQANYWKAQHQKAIEREGLLRQKVEEQDLIIREQSKQIIQLTKEIEELRSVVSLLRKQLFGRKSEKQVIDDGDDLENDPDNDDGQGGQEKRSRGQQKGSCGHGRQEHPHLPAQEVIYDLEEEHKRCPICGKERRLLPMTQDSQEVTIEVSIKRIIHRRKQYEAGCCCADGPRMLVAPGPAKLIPKGKFSTDFWIHILMEKFLFQRPMHRTLESLKLEGLPLSAGTLTGGLEKIAVMVRPLYVGILERSRGGNHWHMDETRWLVFSAADEQVKNQRWWLWVIITKDTCVYLLDPTRSRKVIFDHLGENPRGIINSDRYSVYQNLGENAIAAYCWAHMRRDFVRVYDTGKRLRPWAQEWINHIASIYRANDQRLKVLSNPGFFKQEDMTLRQQVDVMKERCQQQLKDQDLHSKARYALESLNRHWHGYITFIDHPQIPMDNNISERRLREPAVGRKNYYGSGCEWSGMLTVSLFTLFQTLLLHHIHPRKFLKAYFEACAHNQGNPPPNAENFLPWNLCDSQKAQWAMTPANGP